jgi:hypothetical protein
MELSLLLDNDTKRSRRSSEMFGGIFASYVSRQRYEKYAILTDYE